MARKLRSKKGSRIYAQRSNREPVTARSKECRVCDAFLLRGLEKVETAKWHLIAAQRTTCSSVQVQGSQQQALAAAYG